MPLQYFWTKSKRGDEVAIFCRETGETEDGPYITWLDIYKQDSYGDDVEFAEDFIVGPEIPAWDGVTNG